MKQLVRQQLVRQAAGVLSVALSQLTNGGSVIREVLDYFNTGQLAHRPESDHEPFPLFVRQRLLAVGDTLLAVRSVREDRHPIVRTVRDAFVSFSVEDEVQEIPPWQVVSPADRVLSHLNAAYTFTSAPPVTENLIDFARLVLSSPPSLELPTGTPTLEQWMAERRARDGYQQT